MSGKLKVAKNVKVGDVVEFPAYCFSKTRSGWNGWDFQLAIVEKLYTSTKGFACAKIRYCCGMKNNHDLSTCIEDTKGIKLENLFTYEYMDLAERNYKELREAEAEGQSVCWSRDTALLVKHGILK